MHVKSNISLNQIDSASIFSCLVSDIDNIVEMMS